MFDGPINNGMYVVSTVDKEFESILKKSLNTIQLKFSSQGQLVSDPSYRKNLFPRVILQVFKATLGDDMFLKAEIKFCANQCECPCPLP